MKITFYGASDDIVTFAVDGKTEEVYTDLGTFTVTHQTETGAVEGISLEVEYGDMGVWGVKVEPIEEGFPIPNWPIFVTSPPSATEYSTMLVVQAPDGAVVEQIK